MTPSLSSTTPLRALALLVCTVLAACATSPKLRPEVDYNTSYDFSAVRTVALYQNSGLAPGENPLLLSDMARDRIDLALTRAIEAKGLSMVEDPARADLLLSWHLATEDRIETQTVARPTGPMMARGPMMGGGMFWGPAFHPYNRYSFYQCWSCMATTTEVRTREYRIGTFIVDLIDPAEQKSMWRSVTSTRLRGKLERDQDKYDAAAETVLADFLPASSGNSYTPDS
jgi:hypothetical protein